MPTLYLPMTGYKCEGCGFSSHNRREVKKHIYLMRKDRNKSDKRVHK